MLVEEHLTIDDYEKDFDGAWRIFNGESWVHACNTKSQAISRAKILGGTAVGKAAFNEETGMNEYRSVEAVE